MNGFTSRLAIIIVSFALLSLKCHSQTTARDYFNLSYSLTEQHLPDSAMYYLSFAIKMDSSMVNAYYNRGLLRLRKNDFLGALEDFDRCVQREISYGQAYNNKGIIYITLGDTQNGCKNLRIARDLGIEQAKGNFELYCKLFKE